MERTFTLLEILKEETDRDHTLSMAEILARLLERGIRTERKAVYRSMEALREAGFEVASLRRMRRHGYYLKRPFSAAEVWILKDLLTQSVSLSEKETDAILRKLDQLLSPFEKESLPVSVPAGLKTKNTHVLSVLETALHAIRERRFLDFRYYDLSVTRKKQYRRTGKPYHLLPAAVMSEFGRFYIVFYSPKYKNFASYRADKIDSVTESEEISDPVFFDEENWRRNSFQMYAGDAITVTLECPLSLVSQIYDQFGSDLIISRVSADTFTVNVRSALTPPLISWILTFYDEITVKKPKALIDELLKISGVLMEKYG